MSPSRPTVDAPPCEAHESRRWSCPQCRALYQRAYHERSLRPLRQKRRAQRSEDGDCSYCGAELPQGHAYAWCDSCREYFRKAKANSRQNQ